MRYRFLSAFALAFVLTTLACNTYGQYFTATGGRSLGMAGSSLLLEDEYGIFNNPGSTTANSLSFLAAYNTQYLGLGLNDARIGLVLPFTKFTTGIGVMYFGDDLLNQIRVSGLVADQFGFAKVSVRGSYHQFYVQNYGYQNAFTVDIGGVFTISEQIKLAMVFQNLTRAKLIKESETPLSSFIQIGLSYQPIKKFRIDVQLDKSIELPIDFRLGMEYNATDLIAIRTGFSPSTNLAALGIGLSWKFFVLDFAGNYQHQLGYSGMMSVKIIKLKK
ncbi:MAG: hypothetical protein DRI71_03805 [Bacteroidetes bacterium]|nr:MAG: hypothetical protein DRI71_03805 [Bacteroidota bacterium]